MKVRTFILHSVKKYTIRKTAYIVLLLTLKETMHHSSWLIFCISCLIIAQIFIVDVVNKNLLLIKTFLAGGLNE